MSERRATLPSFVTFATGAELLRVLGIDPEATADSVRHIARSRESWPFGDRPGQTPYERIANARAMPTDVFLAYLEKEPPNPRGRGRDKKPRAKPGGSG
ncbi:hypothetical protein [Streptomyces lateritius]|uniref:hypothetical protein n=1 Tax=Streptomyces lateritius TaxID=67313 RepID=UPI00167553C0|nr:hypothetical protein [Streptomyces lateritius]GGU11389.1 hypothetical protein GCM10010272_65760 [Streptomyces lateritius]